MVGPLVIYSQLMYLIIRVIGLGIAIDFYHNTKENRFKLAILGWGFWVIASTSSVYSAFFIDQTIIELLLFLNTFFVSLGTIIYIWVVFSYFLEVSKKLLFYILTILSILYVTIFIIVNYRVAVTLIRILTTITLFSIYIVPVIRWKSFKENMGTALKWYYVFLINLGIYMPISIYINSLSSGYYGLYQSNDVFLIFLNYIPSICFSLVLVILLIHVEYNHSNKQKFELKDKYSHNLGNLMQMIYSSTDLETMRSDLDEKSSVNLKLIRDKCKEASKLIRDIRKI